MLTAIVGSFALILSWTPDAVRNEAYDNGDLDGIAAYVETHEDATGCRFIVDDATIGCKGSADFWSPQP